MTTLPTIPTSIVSLSSVNLKSWTVEDYYRLSELGILDGDDRTELIIGQIVIMAAKGTLHVVALQLLTHKLAAQLEQIALIRTQDPIRLNDFSEPEPDLAIVKGTILDYTQHHPRPEDIYLVVEIADSTLKTDCEVKDKLYAQAGITDYWVIDIKNRQVHIFREPTSTGYNNNFILTESQTVSPLAFSHIILPIASILPPAA
jgi:Uma2 family endonuclease